MRDIIWRPYNNKHKMNINKYNRNSSNAKNTKKKSVNGHIK